MGFRLIEPIPMLSPDHALFRAQRFVRTHPCEEAWRQLPAHVEAELRRHRSLSDAEKDQRRACLDQEPAPATDWKFLDTGEALHRTFARCRPTARHRLRVGPRLPKNLRCPD